MKRRYRFHGAVYRAPLELNQQTIPRLQRDDWAVAYHGTRYPEHLIHGFDATETGHQRIYPIDTRGLFVAPNLQEALRWGGTVLELVVPVKNLHGTDYAGNIGRRLHPEFQAAAAHRYPESFRPTLSFSLLMGPEPQALLVGTVGPDQIQTIYRDGVSSMQRLTRDEFLAQEPQLSSIPAWFNPTSTRLSPEDFLRAYAETNRYPVDEVADIFSAYAGDQDFLLYLLTQGGDPQLSEKAARALVPKLDRYLVELSR